MRITDPAGNPIDSVYLALSEDEARELIDALTDLPGADKGWHAHVADATHTREVTVYRDDDKTATFGVTDGLT